MTAQFRPIPKRWIPVLYPMQASVAEMPLRLAMNGASLSRWPHEQGLDVAPATKGHKANEVGRGLILVAGILCRRARMPNL